MEKFSPDRFLETGLKLSQPGNGYRFTSDSLFLADQIQPSKAQKIIDIGSGCGIIALILASRFPALDVVGIELQKPLFDFACQNACDNGLERTVKFIHADIKNVSVTDVGGPADIIVSNPPFKKKGSGRLNPDPMKACARHELFLDIGQVFYHSKRLLKQSGRVCVIFPAERETDLVRAANRHGFSAITLRRVHTKKSNPPRRVVFCGKIEKPSHCRVLPPLYIDTGRE